MVTKRHQKLKFFLEPKSVNQNLSNDVFGMFIRFIDQILWKFQNFEKSSKSQKETKNSIFCDF